MTVTPFPTDIPQIPVSLTGTEWMAVMLKLAGRNPNATHRAALESAEPKMMAQLKMEG